MLNGDIMVTMDIVYKWYKQLSVEGEKPSGCFSFPKRDENFGKVAKIICSDRFLTIVVLERTVHS